MCRYLAIDGVAPRAKMNQQRSRRFRSQQEAKETREAEAKLRAEMEAKGMALPPPKPPSWDHNVITPGTPFMADLTAFLRKLVAERVAQHPAWQQLAVVLSDASVPGEGEHKLIEHVRTSQGQPGYDPNCRHVIVGDDADLIMLALATHELHFSIVRTKRFVDRAAEAAAAAAAAAGVAGFVDSSAQLAEHAQAQQEEEDLAAGWQLLHVPVLREYLEIEFRGDLRALGGDSAAHFERIVDDFVFLCFFVGNDFLPHLPSLDIREGALDLLLQIYRVTVLSPGRSQPGAEPLWLTDSGDVDFANVQPLLSRLAEVEVAILARRRQRAERESKPKNQTQCIHFARRGSCREGDRCGFLHGSFCPLDESNKDTEGEMRTQMQAFLRDGSGANTEAGEMAMSATLNSFQRRLCHKLAEELGLGHESRGAGQQRRIYLWRLAAANATESAEAVASAAADGGPAEPASERGAGMLAEAFLQTLQGVLDELQNKEAKELDDGLALGTGGDWRGDYYQAKFGKGQPGGQAGADARKPPPQLVHDYLQGLQWVLHCEPLLLSTWTPVAVSRSLTMMRLPADYYRGCCSWSWFFPYHYPPVATDIAAALPTHKPAEFRLAAPLSPLEQLMGVFPAASAHCLPAVCRELMESPSSPIVDFYPVDFALDPNGARMKWQWIALLPFIVEDRLSAAVEQSVLPHLTPLEKKRNELSDRGLLFANSETQLGRLLESVSAETVLGKGVQLSGRVGETAASKEVPSGVALGTFAPPLAADRRKAGLQPGAEPPPSTLDGFAPSGPRPRMTLADLRPMRGGGAPDRRDDGRAT